MAAFTFPTSKGSMEFVNLAQPHWEALTDETRNAFHLVGRLPFIQRFYLAGGTGWPCTWDIVFRLTWTFSRPIPLRLGQTNARSFEIPWKSLRWQSPMTRI